MTSVADFDRMPAAAAAELLRPCCASSRWVSTVVAGRPFATLEVLTAGSQAALDELAWPDVAEALAAHPKIGERAPGADTESAWSRNEQSGVGAEDADQLRAGNIAYEQKFGWVFLICATGLSSGEMLASLTSRLPNPPAAEQDVVRVELGKIVALRLAKVFTS